MPKIGKLQSKNVTREVFLPTVGGYIQAGTAYNYEHHGVAEGEADANAPYVLNEMKLPGDFVSFVSAKAVWVCESDGNMYWRQSAGYAGEGDDISWYFEDTGWRTTENSGPYLVNVQEAGTGLTLPNLAKGMYLGLRFQRNGLDLLDTLDDYVEFLGHLFTYIAEQ